MNENLRTLDGLRQMQAAPLSVKVRMTMVRIQEWVNEYGEDGVYLAFSGGKDSTVLLDIIRNKCGYKNIPAVFADIPTQFPELKAFVKTFDNVEIIKPTIGFNQVCEQYGFPMISKEVSESVQGARKYLRELLNKQTNKQIIPYRYWYERITGTGNYEKVSTTPSADESAILNPTRGGEITSIENSEELANFLNERIKQKAGGSNQRLAIMLGMLTKDKENRVQANCPSENRSQYSMERYKYFLEAPFEISHKCCDVMKKKPMHKYSKDTGRLPITAQMAAESRLRTQKWIQHGCNGFDMKSPISNPMSFWTENDVLQYIVENNLLICSVYGDIVEDYGEQLDGQMNIADYGLAEPEKKYKTTGCSRTGCACCAFGAHCENKEESRFRALHESHPKLYKLLDLCTNNGVTYREAIEWHNAHVKDQYKIWL